MVVKYITKGGSRIHGPPYSKAEEAEFYRRIGGGPITVARPPSDRNRKATERDDDGSGKDHRRAGLSQEETGSR